MAIILFGILVIAVAIILSLLNMFGMFGEVFSNGFSGNSGSAVKKGVKKHILTMVLYVVGLAILAIGIVLAIF